MKKVEERNRKEMRENVKEYNRMYGSFMDAMKSTQMFYLLISLILLVCVILYFVFR